MNEPRTLQFTSNGSQYRATVDDSGKLLRAQVFISFHDRPSVWRIVKNPVTLARLQADIHPPPKCPTCGQPMKEGWP